MVIKCSDIVLREIVLSQRLDKPIHVIRHAFHRNVKLGRDLSDNLLSGTAFG